MVGPASSGRLLRAARKSQLLDDLNGISGRTVAGDDCFHRCCEVSAAFPGREQVDIFAWAFEDAVRLDRVPTGEGEAVTPGDSEPDLREPQMTWIHG